MQGAVSGFVVSFWLQKRIDQGKLKVGFGCFFVLPTLGIMNFFHGIASAGARVCGRPSGRIGGRKSG